MSMTPITELHLTFQTLTSRHHENFEPLTRHAVILTSHYKTTRGLLVTDRVSLSLAQVTMTTPMCWHPSSNYHITITGRFCLDRNLTSIASSTRWLFSNTRLELMTSLSEVRYLDH
ncbi:hypothetical protein TNCV_3229131 [Trichonephila clavipes]|nr:hypothetical protein TNCV_3229131 [Trichonephila clavipes]